MNFSFNYVSLADNFFLIKEEDVAITPSVENILVYTGLMPVMIASVRTVLVYRVENDRIWHIERMGAPVLKLIRILPEGDDA